MSKYAYQYIFDLLDFADYLINQIDSNDFDRAMYFTTLVYIENILDVYGRGLVVDSARTAGFSENDVADLKRRANDRLDTLRKALAHFVEKYDFDSVLDDHGEDLKKRWRKHY